MAVIAGEKRKFFRHPIHVPMQLHLAREKDPVISHAQDISLGGLCFVWNAKLSKGNVLHITIPVKDKMFKVKAKVVYSRQDKSGVFRTGVCFCDEPSAFRAKLAEEALKILEYRNTLSRRGQDISEEEAAKLWISEYAERFPELGS